MGAIACRMCSAPLKIDDDGIFARCSYCGMVYTLPLDGETPEERAVRAEPVLRRARMYLADKNFSEAADSYEKVLDIMPDCGEAYLGKGLAQLEIMTPAELRQIKRKAMLNYYIKKALIFCRGDLRAELLDGLGMKTRIEWHNRTMNQWRSEVLAIRKAFWRDVRESVEGTNTEYNEKFSEIEEKYSESSTKLRKDLDSCMKEIEQIRIKMRSDLNMELVIDADNKLYELNRKKDVLERELTKVNSRLSYELDDLAGEYSKHTDKVSYAEFARLAKKHPLPGCVYDEEASVIDRVYNILLSEYDFLAMSEIASHEICRGVSERRLESAVRKLLFDRRIISVNIDGMDCYAPNDVDIDLIEIK